MMMIGMLSWIAVGALVGFIASKMVSLRGDEPLLGIGCAVGGAILSAALYRMISGTVVTAWTPWSLCFAAIGAIVAVTTWHLVRSRTITHERFTTRRSY